MAFVTSRRSSVRWPRLLRACTANVLDDDHSRRSDAPRTSGGSHHEKPSNCRYTTSRWPSREEIRNAAVSLGSSVPDCVLHCCACTASGSQARLQRKLSGMAELVFCSRTGGVKRKWVMRGHSGRDALYQHDQARDSLRGWTSARQSFPGTCTAPKHIGSLSCTS